MVGFAVSVFAPYECYDEPETLPYSVRPFCPIGRLMADSIDHMKLQPETSRPSLGVLYLSRGTRITRQTAVVEPLPVAGHAWC